MKRILLAALLAPSLLAGLSNSGKREGIEQPSQLILPIQNYAKVEDDVLPRAERESNRIFPQGGIQTDWLNCPTSPAQAATNRACGTKPGLDHLILKLLPQSMSKKYGFKRGTCGFALPTSEGVPGNAIPGNGRQGGGRF